jgi:hypothetical protein
VVLFSGSFIEVDQKWWGLFFLLAIFFNAFLIFVLSNKRKQALLSEQLGKG